MSVLKLVTCLTGIISIITTFPMLPSRDLRDLNLGWPCVRLKWRALSLRRKGRRHAGEGS